MVGIESEGPDQRRRQLLVALLFVATSAFLLYMPESTQASVANVVRATVLMPFIGLNEARTRAGERADDFEMLRTQMDSVLSTIAAQRTLAEENRQLRGLLDLKERSENQFVAATVIRPGTPGAESVFLLDVGLRDGARIYAPVITDGGLLGVIQTVENTNALAIDWSNPDFRVSVMTSDGLSHGLIGSVRGLFREQDRMILRGTAFLSDLAPGTELQTSGRGGVWPRGVLVGWVDGVAEASSGWDKSYYVVPAVYPGSVTHALVQLVGLEEESQSPVADSLGGTLP